MISTSVRRRRAVAAGGVGALVAGIASSALALAAPASADPADAGVLDWGLKESFIHYVEGPIADGEVEMIPPATRNDDGTFHFPNGTGDVDPGAGTAALGFEGGIYLYGHSGVLEMWIEEPRLQIADGAGVLVVDLTSGTEVHDDLALVTVDLTGQSLQPDPSGVVTITDAPTTLSDTGATAFSSFYEAGTPFDPLTMSVTIDGGPTSAPPTTTSAPPTSEPPTTPPTSAPPTSVPPTSVPPTSSTTSNPPPPPPPDPSESATWEEGEVSSGLLDWGVKESFRSYIAGPIADGGWELVGGVRETGGVFRWTSSFGEYDMDDEAGSVGFGGGVRFTGHEGSLDITLSRPRVRFDGDSSAVLVLDVRSKSLEDENYTEQTSVDFATLDLSRGTSKIGKNTVGYSSVPATLTAAGSEGFGGFYEEGTELDALTISFAVGGAEVPGGGSAGGPGGLPGTGSSDALALAGIGSLLALVGAGFVLMARRLRSVTS